jgi:hypothetical protein
VPPGARAPFVLLLALAAAPRVTRAEPAAAPHARLVYFVDPTASGCPTTEEFRGAVNARAGHELFGEPADITIDVTLRRLDAAYVATVGLPDASSSRIATRELRSETGCAELATAAALVASIALDPESILRVPPPAPPPPPGSPPPARASRPWRALLGLGPRGAWGLTPETTFGLALSAAAVTDRLAVGVELGGLVADEARYGRGSVSVLPLTLSLLPCGMTAHFELCAVAQLGLVRGVGTGFDENFSIWKAFAAAGARGGGFVDLGRLRFRASIEGTAVLPTTTFMVNQTAVYATRGVSVAAGFDALLFFQ